MTKHTFPFRSCLTGILALSSLLLFPLSASATDYLTSLGETVAVNGHTVFAEAGDGFLMDVMANRSYSCEGIPSNSYSEFAFSTAVTGTVGSEVVEGRATGRMSPAITGGLGTNGKTRISFEPGRADRYRLAVESAKSQEDVRVRCVDTTLFGGYNTSVSGYNFLELRNVSTAPISARITAVDYLGNILIDANEVSVPPGRRFDFDLHSRVGQASYGLIKITHDGPPHTLRGWVSYYSRFPFVFRGSIRLRPALN